jgi:hypothetical protein
METDGEKQIARQLQHLADIGMTTLADVAEGIVFGCRMLKCCIIMLPHNALVYDRWRACRFRYVRPATFAMRMYTAQQPTSTVKHFHPLPSYGNAGYEKDPPTNHHYVIP